MICTTLSDLYYVERFELRWMICTALNYLHRVELFVVQRWMICTTLNEFYYVEWFVQRWMIFYFVAKFVPLQMTCTAKELYNVERLVIGFLMSARCTSSRTSCKIFCTNLWIDFSLTWKYQEYSALPLKLVK